MADLAVSLQLNAEDLMSPQVNRALRSIQQLQRGVQSLNGATVGARGAADGGGIGQQAQQATRQVGGLNDALRDLLPNIAQVGVRAGPWVALSIGLSAAAGRAVTLQSRLQQASLVLRTFAGSGREADAMLVAVRENAQQTGRTLPEALDAAVSLAPIARTTDQMREALRLAERLSVLAPEQGIAGAAFALREAQAGQYESLAERENISRSLINRLKAQGLEGLPLVSAALDELGVTFEDVAERGRTFEGQTNRLSAALDGLLVRASAPAFRQLNDSLAGINENLTQPEGGAKPPMLQTLEDMALLIGQLTRVGVFAGGLGLQGLLSPFIGLDWIFRTLTRLPDPAAMRAALAARGLQGPAGAGDQFAAGRLLAARALRGDEWPRIAARVAGSRGFGEAASIAAATSANRAAVDAYIGQLDALQHMDDALRAHARSWGSVQTAVLDASNQVDFFARKTAELQQQSGFAQGIRGELERARALERRMGTYGGEYDRAIIDLLRRENRYTLGEGEAALQEYLAAREREARGGEFALDRVRVDEQHVTATNVYVNGGAPGGGQPSLISGSGLPAQGPPRGGARYDGSRRTWPWTPGTSSAGAIG